MNLFRAATLLVVGSMLCSNAAAIVVRHDVPDSDYRAAEADYPALFALYRTALGHGDCIATVVADGWALTAAHCAREEVLLDAVQPGAEGYAVEIAGRKVLIDRVVLHGAGEQQSADIALLRFKQAVDHVQPIALYSGSDEVGRVIAIPGWGGTGNGKSGLAPEDGAFRVACNRVDRAENGRLFWTFDHPDSGALPLEGISGPGDSGGPALLPVANGWVLAGISSAQDTKGGAEGLYGVEEIFVRVSDFVDWIEGVIGNDSLASDAQPTGRECGAPGVTKGTVARDSEIALKIDHYLRAMEAMGFSGAIIVDAGGDVVLRKGYGLADRQAGRPYTPATVQTHGSITKQMTAAAILLLEHRGELSVDDGITSYFDGVPEDKRDVTIHQLLTHSSGLPGSIGRDNEPIDAEAFTERTMAAPLTFEPGSGYSYSNVGYSLLGIIVERVSGKTYETFLREELLLPAGLAETGYLSPGWDPERLAVGYLDGERWGRVHQRQWREDGPGWHLRANGGLHTTVDDMHRWLETVRGRGVLPEDAAERWTTGYVDEGGGNSKYAYGWAVHDTEAGPLVAHNGGNGIFSADFVWLPEQAFFLYIQGNTSVVAAARQRDALLAAAFDPAFEMPPVVSGSRTAEPETAKAREGEYRMDEGSIELKADHTRLIAMLSGQNALDLMLGHGEAQRNRFAELNRRAMEIARKLEAGREDAMEGMVGEDEDAVVRARSMLGVIERGGELRSLTLVGSIENVPGSRFADSGPWTTFVRAEFDQLTQMWSVLWHEDGTYRGTAIGPSSDVPSLILVPEGADRYTGIRREPPWDTAQIRFVDGCLVAAKLQACREP